MLAQARKTPGFHVVGIAGLDVAKVRASLQRTGWQAVEYAASPLGDAMDTAQSDIKAGSMVDGEGGFASWAKSVSAVISTGIDALPIGLAHNVKPKNDVKRDQMLRVSDVELVDDLGSGRKQDQRAGTGAVARHIGTAAAQVLAGRLANRDGGLVRRPGDRIVA